MAWVSFPKRLNCWRARAQGRDKLLARLCRRVTTTARLGRHPRRQAEPFAGAGHAEARQPATRRHRRMGARVMAWWRARVVAPVRRACRLAVAAARARVRKGECGVLNLHQDVQTCGYHDVQVMWDMLSSDREAAVVAAAASAQAKQQRQQRRRRKRPSFWAARSPRAAAVQ